MGSLRNPVGSLAPAVYWRRRVLVLLAVLAVLALLLYACSGSGSGKKKPAANGKNSTPTAAQSSTPTTGGTSAPAASGGASGATSASGAAPTGTGGGTAPASGGNNGASGGTGGTGGASGGTGGASGGGTGPGSGGTSGPGCQLTLSLTSQAAAYANGDSPQFTVAVVNKGTSDCDVDVSPKSLVLNVFSGSDHIWSSADCATGGKDLRGIAPGAVQTVTFSWNRTRSSQGCPAGAAPAKLGMYYGVVSLGPGSGPNAPAAQSQPKTFELKTGS